LVFLSLAVVGRETPVETRVLAAAASAKLASWAGVKFAVDVCESPYFLMAAATVLREPATFPSPVRVATLAALSALSRRHKARHFIKTLGYHEEVTKAARIAVQSGDHEFAAMASVAAGHVRGNSVDQFGFIIPEPVHPPPPPPPHRPRRGAAARAARPSSAKGLEEVSEDYRNDRFMSERDYSNQVGASPLAAFAFLDPSSDAATQNSRPASCRSVPPTSWDWESGRGMSITNPRFSCLQKSDGQLNEHRAAKVSRQELFNQTLRFIVEQSPGGGGGHLSFRLFQRSSAKKWTDLVENPTLMRTRRRAYISLAGRGVPDVLRWRIWPIFLDIASLRAARPGLYASHFGHSIPADLDHVIDADVTRTMPMHQLFWKEGAASGVESLRSVLRAYADFEPEVGYCQGMSFIAGMLLLNSGDDEEAFLMLVQFMRQLKYTEAFKPGFPQAKRWMEQFKYLANRKYPATMNRLNALGVEPELFVDKWYLTALGYNFPHAAVFRLWDIMLSSLSIKIVTQAGLTVLGLSRLKLNTLGFEDTLSFLQRGFAAPGSGVLDDIDQFVRLAQRWRFSYARVERRTSEEGAEAEGAEAVRRLTPVRGLKKAIRRE